MGLGLGEISPTSGGRDEGASADSILCFVVEETNSFRCKMTYIYIYIEKSAYILELSNQIYSPGADEALEIQEIPLRWVLVGKYSQKAFQL